MTYIKISFSAERFSCAKARRSELPLLSRDAVSASPAVGSGRSGSRSLASEAAVRSQLCPIDSSQGNEKEGNLIVFAI